jgi:hypothetical protein
MCTRVVREAAWSCTDGVRVEGEVAVGPRGKADPSPIPERLRTGGRRMRRCGGASRRHARNYRRNQTRAWAALFTLDQDRRTRTVMPSTRAYPHTDDRVHTLRAFFAKPLAGENASPRSRDCIHDCIETIGVIKRELGPPCSRSIDDELHALDRSVCDRWSLTRRSTRTAAPAHVLRQARQSTLS